MRGPYKFLIFDLDDTLMDTSARLVPQAARESCDAMIRAGLSATADDAQLERQKFVRQQPRENVYTHLVQKFGVRSGATGAAVEAAGYEAFHGRDVERDIQLFPGARTLLEDLAAKDYTLYLVTSGDERTQKRKVEILDIGKHFVQTIFVDPRRGDSKQKAFRQIMSAATLRPDLAINNVSVGQQQISRSTPIATVPQDFLSIGNRVDTDIAPAKELGWQTCWLRVGEYAHMSPQTPLEFPDFEISQIQDLSGACRL